MAIKQTQRVLDYMNQHGGITPLDAMRELGVMRLAARISDLRKEGYCIVSSREAVKNRFEETIYVKRYRLEAGHGHQANC